MRYLECPLEDKEGWARVFELYPACTPVLGTIGAGLSAENPIPVLSMGYPVLAAYPFSDEDRAYFMAKAIHEVYDIMAPKHESLKAYWTMEDNFEMWENTTKAPMHAGAVRYYKEIGEWTAEREAMNQERLKHDVELKALWDAAVVEASEQGIKSTDFPTFWLEKRAAAGFYELWILP